MDRLRGLPLDSGPPPRWTVGQRDLQQPRLPGAGRDHPLLEVCLRGQSVAGVLLGGCLEVWARPHRAAPACISTPAARLGAAGVFQVTGPRRRLPVLRRRYCPRTPRREGRIQGPPAIPQRALGGRGRAYKRRPCRRGLRGPTCLRGRERATRPPMTGDGIGLRSPPCG